MNKLVSKLFIIAPILFLTSCNEVKPFEAKLKKYGSQLDRDIFFDQLNISTKSNAQAFFGTDNISSSNFLVFALKQNIEFTGISSTKTGGTGKADSSANATQNELKIIIDLRNQRLSYSSSTKRYETASKCQEDFNTYRTEVAYDQQNAYIEWGETYKVINPDLKTIKIYSDSYRPATLRIINDLLSECFFPSASYYYNNVKFYKNGNVFTISSEHNDESHLVQLDFTNSKKISVKSKDISNYAKSLHTTFTQYEIKPTSSKVKKINYKNFYPVA